MSTYYNSQQAKQSQANNEIINKNDRNDTILTNPSEMSTFDKSFQQATTFNSGKAIPILIQEVYPSDIYEIKVDSNIRLSAPAGNPLMNINYDINFFFVPFKQIDSRFQEVMGENKEYGYSNNMLTLPMIDNVDIKYNENDLGNYFNIPINTYLQRNGNSQTTINNIYPFLAYSKIWNDWYRDQNLQSSIDITSVYKNPDRKLNQPHWLEDKDKGFLATLKYGKGLAPTSKLPNYFTTCLPYQQKGNPIPLGANELDDLFIRNTSHPKQLNLFSPNWYDNKGSFSQAGSLKTNGHGPTEIGDITGGYKGQGFLSLEIASKKKDPTFTITDLRNSIVNQHLLENFALCGSRYVEQLSSIWGIDVDPLEIDRVELIGGFNDSLVYNNVVQTSETSTNNFLGKLATNLFNTIDNGTVEYASSQHGYIIGILTCRTSINLGGQGLPYIFTQKDRLDFHNPLFNGISEQPIKREQIYYIENETENNKIFGYNEPFLWTKYNIDNANGYFSLNSKTSLFPTMLFGEKYTPDNPPYLNGKWMEYDPNIIGNTLYDVSDSTKEFYHQFIAMFTFTIKYTTKQPLFNSPRIDYI